MRLAVLAEPKRFEISDEPVPDVGPDQVLLRVAACGVCASELDIYTGLSGHATYPWYPGHEVSGTVERVGEAVRTVAPGDPVAVWVATRGFADYVVADAEHCFVSGSVPLELSLAEPLACAVNAVELSQVSLGDDVVVIGAGFMGHLVHKLVELRGPRQIIVADVRDDALKRAESFGATATVNVAKGSLPEAVKDLTAGVGADVTFEVTGTQSALSAVGSCTRMSGTLVIAGYHQGPSREVPMAEWNWMAFRIANAHFRDMATILRGMGVAVRLLASGRFSMDGLVTHRFPLDAIDEAFRTAIEKPDGFVKATVLP